MLPVPGPWKVQQRGQGSWRNGDMGAWAEGTQGSSSLSAGVEVFGEGYELLPQMPEAQRPLLSNPRATQTLPKSLKLPHPKGCPQELLWSVSCGHLPPKPAHSPRVASGQPGFLANPVDAKFLWSVATCYPKEEQHRQQDHASHGQDSDSPRQTAQAPPTHTLGVAPQAHPRAPARRGNTYQ